MLSYGRSELLHQNNLITICQCQHEDSIGGIHSIERLALQCPELIVNLLLDIKPLSLKDYLRITHGRR